MFDNFDLSIFTRQLFLCFSGVVKETLEDIFNESKRTQMYQYYLGSGITTEFNEAQVKEWSSIAAFHPLSANSIGDIFQSFILSKYLDFIDEMKKIKFEMVSFDHTFHSASNIVTVTDCVVKKQFKSLILIINEVGLIGRYAFLKNEGLVI